MSSSSLALADRSLLTALETRLGARVTQARSLTGGDIAQAFQLTVDNGSTFFLKTGPGLGAAFRAEAAGLAWLAEGRSVQVPPVLGVCGKHETPFLLLEFVAQGPPSARHEEALGRSLARLHQLPLTACSSYGWHQNNFIGSLLQDNSPSSNWLEFWRERRLLPQLELATARNALTQRERRMLDTALLRLEQHFLPNETPSRVHGDLWSGNVLAGSDGAPWLIDPACYWGIGEVDLSMMRLFGGFGARTFAAYDELRPPSPVRSERLAALALYPLLVHVNLFGRSYVATLLETARQF